VPRAYLDAVAAPDVDDLSGAELAAFEFAEDSFIAGVPIVNTYFTTKVPVGAPHDPFWPERIPASPLANLYPWQGGSPGPQNSPVELIATLTESGALTMDPTSLPVLSAARAHSVRELPIWIVYV